MVSTRIRPSYPRFRLTRAFDRALFYGRPYDEIVIFGGWPWRNFLTLTRYPKKFPPTKLTRERFARAAAYIGYTGQLFVEAGS